MKLNELKPAEGSKKKRRRVGRGLGSGRGKTAGRGQKGQLSRSGYSKGPLWEGGRSRLFERLPKRGFNNKRFNKDYQIINLADLNKFTEGSTVNAQTLKTLGLISHISCPVKLLSNGELKVKKLIIELDSYSKTAVKAVETMEGTLITKNSLEKAEEST